MSYLIVHHSETKFARLCIMKLFYIMLEELSNNLFVHRNYMADLAIGSIK